MRYLCTDVLRLILLLMREDHEILRCSGVCRRWRRLLDRQRARILHANQWRLQRFDRLREFRRRADSLYIHYEGYEAASLWANYKRCIARRFLLRARVGGTDLARAYTIGIAYTWNRWQSTHWLMKSLNTAPVIARERPDRDAYRMPSNASATVSPRYDTEAYYRAERRWFYDQRANLVPRWTHDPPCPRTCCREEKTFTINFWYDCDPYEAAYSKHSNCNYGDGDGGGGGELWFALFVTRHDGSRLWDNNSHWNYAACVPREHWDANERERIAARGLLCESTHGYGGT